MVITSLTPSSLSITNIFRDHMKTIYWHPFLGFACWSWLHSANIDSSAQEGFAHRGQDRKEDEHSKFLEDRWLISGCQWGLLGCVHLAVVRELRASLSSLSMHVYLLRRLDSHAEVRAGRVRAAKMFFRPLVLTCRCIIFSFPASNLPPRLDPVRHVITSSPWFTSSFLLLWFRQVDSEL